MPKETLIKERQVLQECIRMLEALLVQAKFRLMAFDLEHFDEFDCCGDKPSQPTAQGD